MICNPLGACVDLRYLNLLNGTIANTSTDAVGNATECSLLDVGKHDSTNCSFSLHRETCVQPPFAFLLSSDPTFNCSQTPCTLSGCWSGYPVFAILVYRPSYVWVPVNASDWVGPVTQTISTKNFQFANPAMPSRNKRNVKNWLLRVGGLDASLFIPAVGDAVLHAWTSDQIALTMEAVNNLANATRDALRAQSQQIDLNSQAILQLQTEIDELGLEMDGLWKVVQEICDTRWIVFKLCVTPVRANMTGTSAKVKDWLKNTYLPQFLNLSQQVETSLDKIGDIQLKPVEFDLSGHGELNPRRVGGDSPQRAVPDGHIEVVPRRELPPCVEAVTECRSLTPVKLGIPNNCEYRVRVCFFSASLTGGERKVE
ncbi:uncharacterized protein LOC143690517 [Tamandua tetradactyla]|uniref:uncharacterized protein LOC143690517 n=1 Tax=Tamandua tetradactyla TaxID=48850 RepID=UPI00405471CF